MSEHAPDGDLSRRGFLRGMGALGATGLVASLVGCSALTDRRYEAAPVALENADEREHRLFDAGTWEVTRSAETLGLDVEATLVNHFTAYRGPEANLGFAAMPAVQEGGQNLNPLASRPLEELVASETARSLLDRVGVDGGDGELEWHRGPEHVESRDLEFFGKETTAKAFAGAPGEDTFVVFEVARVIREGDVVFGVRSKNRDAEGQPMQPLSNHKIDWGKVEEDVEEATRPDRVPDVPDRCEGLRYVAITKPKKNAYLANPKTTVRGGKPAVELTAHARTRVNRSRAAEFNCNPSEKGFCHYKWSYREAGGGGNWRPAGTGQIVTFPLVDKNTTGGFTKYEIRVKAFDSDGNHRSTDTITVRIQAIGG
jgi:hypothetical protein